MMLAVDIGNTHTTFGLFRGRRLVRTFAVSTQAWRSGRGPRLQRVGADQAIIDQIATRTRDKSYETCEHSTRPHVPRVTQGGS